MRTAAASTCTLGATAGIFVGALLLGPHTPSASPRIGAHHPAMQYADGAPPGFSGGFGEQSCHGCHFHAEVNTPPGKVTLEGVPERFTAGERYTLAIVLSRPGMKMGGFQLAARVEDGGAQAGSLAPGQDDSGRVKVETQGGIQYASQTRVGAALSSPGTVRWSVVWTAPDTREPVTFHVSANAADGDESAEGDYVHTEVAESAPLP